MAEAHAHVAHHFDTARQQREAATFAMWAFLVTEIMFFGGAFTAYAVCRSRYPEGFAQGSELLDIVAGAVNTVVLIGSSFTVVLSVHAAREGRRRMLMGFIIATMVLGFAFLGIKTYEYLHKFHEGHVPGRGFALDGRPAPHAELFMGFYFAMTGIHAVHMVIGIGIWTVMLVLAQRGRFSPAYTNPIENTGLYWHFVDLVWIFLFPLLYLVERHG